MFKNKHLVAALIVTPLLAIGGYFMLDAMIGEKPHVARAGESYPLVALPNCRYSSGKCTLKNNQFVLDILPINIGSDTLQLQLDARHALTGVKMALISGSGADTAQTESAPLEMERRDEAGKQWGITLPGTVKQDSQLRLVVAAGDAFYFGETGLAFLHYEAAVGKDLREPQ